MSNNDLTPHACRLFLSNSYAYNILICVFVFGVNHLHHSQLFKYRKQVTGKLCSREE